MPTVLITGANRGLGLEFARQYAADGWTVIATARQPEKAEELNALGVESLPLDAADPQGIAALARAIENRAIDVLIANAGIYPHGMDAAEWSQAFATNSIGPTLLAQALRANVARSEQRKMVAITSRMGSIADNSSGGAIAYRSSKAALNAAWRSLAHEVRKDGISLAVLHPGWVQTDMGGTGASIDAQTSISGLRQVIDRLRIEQTGRFFNYDGQELPW